MKEIQRYEHLANETVKEWNGIELKTVNFVLLSGCCIGAGAHLEKNAIEMQFTN